MDKFRKIFVLAAILCCYIAEAGAITIGECKELARQNYPKVKQYSLIKASETYTLRNVSRQWWPEGQLVAKGTWQNVVPDIKKVMPEALLPQFSDLEGISKIQYGASLNVRQKIWEGGRISAQHRQIKAETEAERERLDVLLYEIEGKVEDMYFGILLLDRQIERIKKSEEIIASNLRHIRSLLKNGTVMQMDADMVEAELLELGQKERILMANRDSYLQMLRLFVGKDDLTVSDLVMPDVPDMTSVTQRPEMNMFNASRNMFDAQAMVAKKDIMPTLEFIGQGTYGYPGLDAYSSMKEHKATFGFVLGLQLTWNFTQFYFLKNKLHRLENQKKTVDVERETFLFSNRQQNSSLNENLKRLEKEEENDRRIVELRTNVRKAVESKVNNGIVDANTLLQKVNEESAAIDELNSHSIEKMQLLYQLAHNGR